MAAQSITIKWDVDPAEDRHVCGCSCGCHVRTVENICRWCGVAQVHATFVPNVFAQAKKESK